MFLPLWLYYGGAALLATVNAAAVHQLVKRSLSNAHSNDYGPPVHVASSVLQLSSHDDADESARHLQAYAAASAAQIENPWKASGLTPGYEVWLQTAAAAEAALEHGSSAHAYAGAAIAHGDGNIFSAHPNVGHAQPLSQLHTHVDNTNHEPLFAVHVNDNIDFHNLADASDQQVKHYSKSYGR